jgi:hypothetical protein
MSLEAMRWRTSPMEAWMAERSSGSGRWKVEGGAAASALARLGDGLSGGVVVVTEFFVVQAGAAAAVAVGEDVAALEALWCFGSGFDDSVLHVSPPLGEKCTKSSKEKTLARTSGSGLLLLRLNAKTRLVSRALLLSLLLL